MSNTEKENLEINCYGTKGGVGKTTIATQLCVAYRLNGKTVAFYDLDKQRTSTNYFSNVLERLRPNEIHHLAGYEHGDVDVVIYDYPPNNDLIPRKGTIVVAPTGSSTFDLHSYAKVLPLEKTHTLIKVLNKVSLARKSDKEALEYFDDCVVISQNSMVESALSAYKTIYNFSHPNTKKAQNQFQFLIDCIVNRKTIKMTPERVFAIGEKGARLKDFIKDDEK